MGTLALRHPKSRKPRVFRGLLENKDGRDARPLPPRLFFVHEVAAAVLLPAAFVRLGAERLFLAVADGFDAIAGDSSLDERILHRIGAIGASARLYSVEPRSSQCPWIVM